jgi:hypothetical protein
MSDTDCIHDVGPYTARACPDFDCTSPDCHGACFIPDPWCPECGATNPFDGAPGCHVCRSLRNDIARSAESAAGWDATA